MKKIITKEERERRDKRNKIVIGVILVGIMILSTAGYAFYSIRGESVEKISYKGIDFVLQEDGFWHFSIQGNEFATINNPNQTQDIFYDNLNLENFPGRVLYFSYDSNREAVNEIFKNIGVFMSRIQEACIDECEKDLPIKNCSENMIIVREASESLIKQEDNCVYILAKQEDIIKASDAFIFKFLGVE